MSTIHTNTITSGSLKELWKISFPLMISFFSLFMMVFVDRIFLSFYSPAALNAAASAGTLSWALILSWSTLVSLAEVFVAQYNGAKQYHMLGEPVWQMIWLSLLSFAFFIPAGLWGGALLYGENHSLNFQYHFFSCTMLFSPFAVLVAALTAFFAGQGKTAIIKWLALIGNLVNVILDPILIFGIKGYIPELGIQGACIATGIGIIVQAVILSFLFLKKSNRVQFGTHQWRFKWRPFVSTFKVGLPPATFILIELLGWSTFYWMMHKISAEHILVVSICQSILFLFLFFGLGIEKGAAIVAGNLIGAGKISQVHQVLRSGYKMLLLFSLVIIFFFVVYPEMLINLFLQNPAAIEGSLDLAALSPDYLQHLRSTIRTGLACTALYIILEDVRWLINGILTAAGDTFFLMISGAVCVWLFLLLPTYFLILKPAADIRFAFLIWIGYAFIAVSLFYLRYRNGKWKEKALMVPTSKSIIISQIK